MAPKNIAPQTDSVTEASQGSGCVPAISQISWVAPGGMCRKGLNAKPIARPPRVNSSGSKNCSRSVKINASIIEPKSMHLKLIGSSPYCETAAK